MCSLNVFMQGVMAHKSRLLVGYFSDPPGIFKRANLRKNARPSSSIFSLVSLIQLFLFFTENKNEGSEMNYLFFQSQMNSKIHEKLNNNNLYLILLTLDKTSVSAKNTKDTRTITLDILIIVRFLADCRMTALHCKTRDLLHDAKSSHQRTFGHKKSHMALILGAKSPKS